MKAEKICGFPVEIVEGFTGACFVNVIKGEIYAVPFNSKPGRWHWNRQKQEWEKE